MKKEKIQDLFLQGIDCSQVVAGFFSEQTGFDRDTLRKMTSCFGGGMMCGETCGAVTGALTVIGLKYGHYTEGDHGQKARMQEKVSEFKQRFLKKYESDMCRELLKHDISQPDELEKVLQEGLMMDFCPCIVQDVIAILEDML